MSAEWNAVSGMINTLGQQDVQRRQKAYYDEQRQELQKQSQQADAVRQSYDQLAKAFQDSGGDMDALAPLVKDAASMQAMSAFVKAYADSEEGVSRAKAATAKRIDESFRIASGHVPKALQSQVGSPEWVSAAQNVAAQGAFGGKLGDYDPQTQTFSVIQPNTVSGWSESDRVSATEVQQALQNFQKGIIQGPRGQMAKEWANAFIRYDITRRAANAEALTDTSKHILLSDGKKTLTVVPQLHESPGGGFVYMVQDPEKGLTIASDLEDYLRKGYKITTQDQMNKETDFSLRRQGHALTAQGHALRAQEQGPKPMTQKDIISTSGGTADRVASAMRETARRYGAGTDVTGLDPLAALAAQAASGEAVMRQQAEQGDPQAMADWTQYQRWAREHTELMNAAIGYTREAAGMGQAQYGPADLYTQPSVQAPLGVPFEGVLPDGRRGRFWKDPRTGSVYEITEDSAPQSAATQGKKK